MMQRFPQGIGQKPIVQQEAPDYFPRWVKRATVREESGSITHAVIDNASTLVYLADQACITPHVWVSRADRPERPDQMIFDLDHPGDEFAFARDAARALRGVLEDLGLTPFVKTSGSRGLHVHVPLDRRADFDAVRAFARQVANTVAAEDPRRLTTEQRKWKRGGRPYIDVMRNAYAQTAVAPYAVRARRRPVASPIDWDELDGRGMRGDRFTLTDVPCA